MPMMTQKVLEALAKDIEHAKGLVEEGVLNTPMSVVKHLAFIIGATGNTFNHNFDWYKWNTAIFGKESEDVSGLENKDV